METNVDNEKNVTQQLDSIDIKYVLAKPDNIIQTLKKSNPSILLIDIDILDAQYKVLKEIKTIESNKKLPIPIVFTSNKDNVHMRLKAICAGSSGFITKPIDLNFLKSTIEIFVPNRITEKYRVLVIDDDKSLSEYTISILNACNMDAVALNDPLDIFHYLIDFKPEVILTDMHMPDCSGSELAQIIRQHQGYAILPIVFISGEQNIDKQIEMRKFGADDFIIKPFKSSHLVEMVYGRAQRYRYINSLIQKDGLTGLLQYNKVKNIAEEAICTALRHGNQLSCVIVDLDHFKRINDTHGHLAGDAVLRSFASLLLRRFRKADIITRYGGEEFLILMPFTGKIEAGKIIDELRKIFVSEEFKSDGKVFNVSFSAGIASIEGAYNIDELIKTADAALYKAKKNGRNRTIIS